VVKVNIFGLALDETSKSPILVLKDEANIRVLPIWIGAMEAMSISVAINKIPFERPLTHDLLFNIIRDMGGVVVKVEIVSLKSGTFFAEIEVAVGKKIQRIDSRPSDAIALAVRAECPIFVSESVLEEAGGQHHEEGQAVIKTEDSATWMDELEKLSEDDTKYKM
jgi:bifunctional DNase/RNase